MISLTSKYALRTLAYLAGLEPGRSLLARELAQLVDAPPQYLAKLLVTLSKAGILSAVRGSGGGYRLGKPGSEVSLARVVEVLEGPLHAPACLLDDSKQCEAPGESCEVLPSWCKVQETYVNFLKNTTVADIAVSK